MILTYNSKYGQNIFDVCMNTYGTLEELVKMLVDNLLTSNLVPVGTIINFDSNLIDDVNVYNNTTKKGVIYSTGIVINNVFGKEDGETIFISEDGSEEFTPET